jgi:tetratricopeptide (TPR) repeat protein
VAAASDPKRALILGSTAVALAVSVHLNALDNPFVYDDHRTVVENRSIRSLRSSWALSYEPYRPVANLSYALDYAVWGLAPWGFHLTSILLHGGAVLGLFALARRAVTDWYARDGRAAGAAGPAETVAFTTAALFAVHPVLTEAVGYVSGRAEILGTAGVLGGLLLARRTLVGGRGGWAALSLVPFGLGVAAKENAAVFPLLLVAYDRLLGSADLPARTRRWWCFHLPLLALMVAGGVLRLLAHRRVSLPVSPGQYLLLELGVVWRYLALLVLPVGQSVVHAVTEPVSLLAGQALLAGASLALLAAIIWRVRRLAPLAALGAAWFVAALAPSSSVVPLNEAMVEHRLYLAAAGAFLAAAAGAGQLVVWGRRRGHLGSPLVPRAALAGVLAALALATVARNQVWADPVRLWRDATTKAPGVWLPWYALGDALRLRGDCAAAVPAYREARRLAPGEPFVYPNLAVCLAATGRLDEAEAVLSQALRLDPGLVRAHTNLGVLAARRGRLDVAREHFRQALAHDPGNLFARQQLAALHETAYADPGEALRLCREIQALAPGTPGVEDCIRRNAGRDSREGPGPRSAPGR